MSKDMIWRLGSFRNWSSAREHEEEEEEVEDDDGDEEESAVVMDVMYVSWSFVEVGWSISSTTMAGFVLVLGELRSWRKKTPKRHSRTGSNL